MVFIAVSAPNDKVDAKPSAEEEVIEEDEYEIAGMFLV